MADGGNSSGKTAKTPTIVPDYLKGVLGKQGKQRSIEDTLKTVNPNYKNWYDTPTEWKINCQRVVYANEMARRGFDVEAKPKIMKGPDPMMSHWREGFEGQTWQENLGKRNTQVEKAINDQMAEWGEGSRAIVYVAWQGTRTAHVFNVENVKGKLVAYDAQVHSTFPIMDYLKDSKPTKTKISRVDNLTTPTQYMEYAVQHR